MSANLMHVQWLPIVEIADLWAPRLRIPIEIVIDELRLGYFKYEKSKTDQRCQRRSDFPSAGRSKNPSRHRTRRPPISGAFLFSPSILRDGIGRGRSVCSGSA
jgi:hypothetical protein